MGATASPSEVIHRSNAVSGKKGKEKELRGRREGRDTLSLFNPPSPDRKKKEEKKFLWEKKRKRQESAIISSASGK